MSNSDFSAFNYRNYTSDLREDVENNKAEAYLKSNEPIDLVSQFKDGQLTIDELFGLLSQWKEQTQEKIDDYGRAERDYGYA
jgi:hypothetical protein